MITPVRRGGSDKYIFLFDGWCDSGFNFLMSSLRLILIYVHEILINLNNPIPSFTILCQRSLMDLNPLMALDNASCEKNTAGAI